MTILRHARSRSLGFAAALGLVFSALAASPAQAALTATDITWDVVGLDSNNVNVGPNHFPIGTRVCNTGPLVASGLTGAFVWDSVNPLINLRAGTATTLPVPPAVINLGVGQCTDFFYEVEITRNPAAYDTKRSYHVALSANSGALTGSTEVPREVFVEHIISQSRNYVLDMQVTPAGGAFTSVPAGGTMTLLVGAQYDIKLVASTATQGYEQIETFINFPNIIFQILTVNTTYSAESSPTLNPPYDMLYGDGCVWEDNPLSPNYRSCLSVGKAGGDVTVTYRVQILAVPSSPLVNPEPLSTLIHDFSGSSYHYNADYGVQTRYANIVNVGFGKSFNPTITAAGGVSVLTFTITNLSAATITGVNFTDIFPVIPGAMVVSAPANFSTSGCGTPTFTPSAGDPSISFSNGTLGPNGVCTISVEVTAPVAGVYNNLSEVLRIGTVSTGLTAAATLTVTAGPGLPSCPGTGTSATHLARWTMEPSQGTTTPPAFSFRSGSVSSATAGFAGGTNAIENVTAGFGAPLNSWSGTGWAANNVGPPAFPSATTAPYYEWVVDTSKFSGVGISFDYLLMPNGDWANPGNNHIYVYSSTDGVNWFNVLDLLAGKGLPMVSQATVAALATGASTTRFRVNAVGANQATARLYLDNIFITGCGFPYPQIAKSFSPDPIAVGATSTLTFTLTNENALALTGVAFVDTLPAGLVVSAIGTPVNNCGGTLTTTVGSPTISLTGGGMAARGATSPFAVTTCTITVPVAASTAGPHNNVSGYITSTQSGINTGPNGSATAILTAVLPPIISKEFSPETIQVAGTSTLTFTIQNPNPNNALSSVAFSDTYPGLVLNTAPPATTTCGGSLVAGAGSVTLSGVTLAAGASCKVTATVTSGTANLAPGYVNTSGNVSHVINGVTVNGNTASDILFVKAASPSLALQKQIGTTSTGPWFSSLIVAAGSPVHYKFVVENTGDVPLTAINVTDPNVTINNPGCGWTNPLPVAVPANDNHITTCVVGPVTALVGNHPNTAQAHGTYSATIYNSNFDTAVYQNGNFGHLPSKYTNMNLYNDGGAMHLNGTTYLGASVTTNASDGINTVNYTPKATDNGVTWSGTWAVGAGGGAVSVTVTCPSASCYLNAWIDWNADGDFNDTSEKLFIDNRMVTNGANTLTFDIPSGALLDGTTLYSRFRVSNSPMTSPQPYGQAMNGTTALVGEIEDPFFIVIGGIVTPVTVASFEARRNGSYVDFEWTTASESGNVGFDIYVQRGKELVAVNPELIPSRKTDSLARQHYFFSAEVEGDTFFIEDVSITGQARQHGPFLTGEVYGGKLEDEKIAWNTIGREHAARQASARTASLQEMALRPGLQNVNLKVRKTGIQRVTYEALVAAGVNPNAGMDRFLLTHRGAAVPIYSQVKNFTPGAFFEFYGEALDTIYTDTNVYQLKIGNRASPAIQEANGAPSAVPVPPASYTETYVLNRQLEYASYAPSGEAWYDTSMLAFTTLQNWAIPFELDALADPSAPASAELVAWGVTDWPQSPDHHLVASLNGEELADESFDGLIEKRWTVDLPVGTLRNGANTLDLTLPGDTGVSWDMVNFDQLQITYQRSFQARDGRLRFTARAQDFQVANLPTKDVIVYRLDSQGLRRLRNVLLQPSGGAFSATFAGSRQSATYIVSTGVALHAPAIERERSRADLNVDAEYLVISHPDFIAGLQPLVEAREDQGLSVNVVDVNDIYASYNFGIFDPQAIRDYIAHAAAELGTHSVLLVGGDTYDYRNYLGVNSISFIPSLYASSGGMVRFIPSDTLYVDQGNFGVPNLAIGRFPVRTNAELDSIIAKTLAYAEKSYGRTAFFAADRTDGGVSFKNLNAGFMQGLPAGWLSQSVNLDDNDVGTAQTQLLAAMNQGTAMVTFTGHSGPREWTFSHLFSNAHAAALTNAGQPFVVVQWGCWNTYYVDPVNTYLVQSFLFSGDRGAAAVLGAATLTDSSSEQMLGQLLTPRMVIPGMSIGQALLEAKRELAQTHPELLDVLLGWSLMGDPALVIEPSATE